MSDAASGSGAVGTPAVHPNTANDAAAVPMPSVPAGTQRMRPSDLMRARRDGSLPGKADAVGRPGQPGGGNQAQAQSPRQHLAEKSRELEARQGSAAAPESGAAQDPNAGAESGTLSELEATEGQEQAGAEGEQGEVNEQTPEGSLSDADIIAKYREWESSDLAPEEIFADKLHAVKVRGQERFVDYHELRQGYMRGSDYHTAGKELKQRAADVDAKERSYKEHFETIKDPEQFLEIYERNGYGEVIEQVAERVAQRRVEHRSVVRAAGRAAAERLGFTSEQIARGDADNHRDVVEAMTRADARLKQTRQTEIENRKLSFERQRFEQERQAAQRAQEVQKHQQTYQAQLNQLRPGAFKASGIQDTTQNRTAFLRHLGDVINLEGLSDQGITRAQVMAAARNLKEEQEDRLAQERGGGLYSEKEMRARMQAEQRRALGPTRTSTGAGRPLQAQQSQARRASEFAGMRRNGLLGK